ncbi:endonuclease domain-containing protein, partial [Chitinophaga agrisoli]|uniref:endonuclease domain-containing protein n=1 Tax=Chitinophaga agrisoli TaxID=2607653 RepID=UPI0016618B2E
MHFTIYRLCHHEKVKHKLTLQQEKEFKKATNCYMCDIEFTEDIEKIREHNHYTSKYRGVACQSCNTKEC